MTITNGESDDGHRDLTGRSALQRQRCRVEPKHVAGREVLPRNVAGIQPRDGIACTKPQHVISPRSIVIPARQNNGRMASCPLVGCPSDIKQPWAGTRVQAGMPGNSSFRCCENSTVWTLSRGQGWCDMTWKTVKQKIKWFYHGVAVQPQPHALLESNHVAPLDDVLKGCTQTIIRKVHHPARSNPMPSFYGRRDRKAKLQRAFFLRFTGSTS